MKTIICIFGIPIIAIFYIIANDFLENEKYDRCVLMYLFMMLSFIIYSSTLISVIENYS